MDDTTLITETITESTPNLTVREDQDRNQNEYTKFRSNHPELDLEDEKPVKLEKPSKQESSDKQE